MNNARMKVLIEQQSGSARKVLEALPIAEPWPVGLVMRELLRQGCNMQMDRVHGCLRSLVDDGLVKHVGDKYARIPLKIEAHTTAPREIEPMPEPQAAPENDTLDEFAVIASMLRKVADRLDAAALKAQGELEAERAKGGALTKLREAMKTLGIGG